MSEFLIWPCEQAGLVLFGTMAFRGMLLSGPLPSQRPLSVPSSPPTFCGFLDSSAPLGQDGWASAGEPWAAAGSWCPLRKGQLHLTARGAVCPSTSHGLLESTSSFHQPCLREMPSTWFLTLLVKGGFVLLVRNVLCSCRKDCGPSISRLRSERDCGQVLWPRSGLPEGDSCQWHLTQLLAGKESPLSG